MKPHKHKDLIIAWANGAEIQLKNIKGNWVETSFPSWETFCEYRIKPEPKPDTVAFTYIDYWMGNFYKQTMGISICVEPHTGNNLKLTFDGETGKLKAAEVLK